MWLVRSPLLLLGAASFISIAAGDGRSELQESSCHAAGSCPSVAAKSNTGGFTNTTGWTADGKACCDICDGSKKVNCFNAATCGTKTGNDDWDFLVMDQIWLPQFCSALEQGHDPTVTHLPGSRCREGSARRTGLSIHGLWPNYVGGYPQCCKHAALPQRLPDDLQALADEEWVDPTTALRDPCGYCTMWAHEMMKHGTCFSTDIVGYFRSALGLIKRLREQTVAANALLELASQRPVSTAFLEKVFAPYSVQILCDPKDTKRTNSTGVFLELRTCWNRTKDFSPEHADPNDLVQIDCIGKAVGESCPSSFIASDFDVAMPYSESLLTV